MANGDIHYLDEAGLQLLWDKIKENFVAGGILQSDASKYTDGWKQNARKNIGMINVGSATQPIYLDANGDIKTITYTLGSACAKTAGNAAGNVPVLDSNAKLALSTIPDVILGQMLMGGTVSWDNDNKGIATISANLKTKLGITDATIQLINSATDDKTQTPKEYGYKTLEGCYFISETSGTVGTGETAITFEKGDWLVSIGTAWKKIDNTDAVTSVNGYTGAVTLYGTDIAVSSTDATKIDAALAGKQAKVAAKGSTTKPLYTSTNGTFSECSTYAGGTAVTLNGTSKAANTASFYAPTVVGSSGQFLKSSGSGAPSWAALANSDIPQQLSGKTYDGMSIDTDSGITLSADTNKLSVFGEVGLAYSSDTGLVIGGNMSTSPVTLIVPTTYTLGDACAKSLAASVVSTDTGLVTAAQVVGYAAPKLASPITANTGSLTFAKWNANGLVTAAGSTAYNTTLTVNGTSYSNILRTSNAALPTIYAPTTVGLNGQYLKSSGNGAPTWASFESPTMSWSDGTSSGPTLNTKDVLGNQLTATIPLATASVSGVVTTGSQTFAGDKTFNGKVQGMQGVSAYGIVDLSNAGGGGGGTGTVTSIQIGSGGTIYDPDTDGKVLIPAYPTSLPLSSITGATSIQNINALTGTTEGFLQKTGANTWAISTSYVASFGTKTGAITVRGGQNTTGAVNLTMSDNQLQASIYDSNSAAYKAAGTANGNVPILGAASTNKNNYPVLFDSNGNLIAGGGAIGSFAYISSLAFSSLTSKPTTIGGYGITDAKIVFGSDDVAQKKCTSTITLGTNTLTTALEITIDTNNVTTGFGLLHKDVLVTMSRISDLVIQNLS